MCYEKRRELRKVFFSRECALMRYYWTCHVGKAADEEGGCDWFEWAEMDDDGENVHPMRHKKRNSVEN